MSLPRLTGSQEKNTALIIYPFFYVAHQVAENEIFSQTGLRSNKCLNAPEQTIPSKTSPEYPECEIKSYHQTSKVCCAILKLLIAVDILLIIKELMYL